MNDDKDLMNLQGRLSYGGRERIEKKLAKAYLMHGFFMRRGEGYDPKVKHLGLGVYEAWAAPMSCEEKKKSERT